MKLQRCLQICQKLLISSIFQDTRKLTNTVRNHVTLTKLEKLDSPACEQAFKWLNEFKNIKSMNELRLKFYLLYMIDLHNMHIGGQVQVKANPLNIDREMILTEMKTKIISKDFDELEMEFDTRLVLNEKEKTFENCYTEREGQLQCNFVQDHIKRRDI